MHIIIILLIIILPILISTYPYIPKLNPLNYELYNNLITNKIEISSLSSLSLNSPLLLTSPYYCTSYTNQSYSCNCRSCDCETCYTCGCSSSIYQCDNGGCDSSIVIVLFFLFILVGECICFFCNCCRTSKCDYPCNCKSVFFSLIAFSY